VLGLDPSLTATGIAYPDGRTATVKTRQKDGDYRLVLIRRAIREAAAMGVDLAMIEDLPTHAHGAGLTGMAQGCVREPLSEAGISCALIPPATLKFYATGNGAASKALMKKVAEEVAGIQFTDDNQCDAFWARIMGLDYLGCAPYLLPERQRATLGQIKLKNSIQAAA
jgi:Holliday junction resolvasome RuvABC endonuclease subunit